MFFCGTLSLLSQVKFCRDLSFCCGLRVDVAIDRVLQRNQRFGRLYFVDRLQFVDQHKLQLFNRLTHQFDEDVVRARGVIRFHHFIQCVEFFQRGMIVARRIEVDADKTAHVVAEFFGVDHHFGTFNDLRRFHLFDAHVNGGRTDVELFSHLCIRRFRVRHQRFQYSAIQIINLGIG
ncbi:hypothetical protein [Vibrio vulnificus YJ016]|uniref:Uncharacterized protein n=1 Tax=Vibrio vulnificus (strain YJ016) TaxID=196600 RepID=Q7MQE0_VIBVY|nr:hypothetical protein [Vibrio vulnificus YJ016]